jgi:hypothetical protein
LTVPGTLLPVPEGSSTGSGPAPPAATGATAATTATTATATASGAVTE